MTAYRFRARSTTPGEYRLAAGTMEVLTPATAIVSGEDRGDGVTGTYPTEAESKAEQLAADQAIVEAAKAGITTETTILGVTGTCPTTAATQAAQLAADVAEVMAHQGDIMQDVTVLGVTGTYDPDTSGYAGGYADGQAAQYATDLAAVEAAKAGITTTTVVLGVQGMLDMSLYMLIPPIMSVRPTPTGSCEGGTGSALMEAFPFRRVFVDHSIESTTRVYWELHPRFRDPGYSCQLQVGKTGLSTATDWEDVGAPVINGYYAEDSTRRLYGKLLETHYRIVLTTSNARYVSQPASVHGILTEKEWLEAREVLRKERMRHGYVSSDGYLLKRLRYGRRCQTCLDPQTMLIQDSRCPECYGTGFTGGYHPPVPLRVDTGTEGIAEQRSAAQAPGQTEVRVNSVRVIAFPMISKEDVWVDAASDERWSVDDIKYTALKRSVPLVAQVTFRLLPFTDTAYRLQVGGEPQDNRYADIPLLGTGSVRVTHDYGGEDALAYQLADGCGVLGATILVFTRADYDAGLRTTAHAVAMTTTVADGRWAMGLCLEPGEYMLVFEKVGEAGPDAHPLTVVTPAAASESASLSVPSSNPYGL